MKVTVPEISFHNRDPVLCIDVQHGSTDGITRMATGGTDSHVVIWQIAPLDTGGVSVEALSDLVRHTKAVNAVRFSPDGNYLASGDDDSAIIIWRRQDSSIAPPPDLFGDDSEEKNKEHWVIHKLLRGHIQDVCDLSWSSCSSYLVSGSIDNSAIIWDAAKGKNIGLLKEHKNFVQGVAFDPQGQYIATLSSDRLLRWFSIGNKRVVHKAQKSCLPQVKDNGTVKNVNTRLFYDDTLKSYCRRLSFSPDGLLLVAPSGVLEDEEPGAKLCNVVHVFTRLSPSKPVMYLPTKDKYTLAVRFCPLLFKLRKGRKDSQYSGQSVFGLPYRMVFAVACQNSVILYDTQQLLPFAKLSNMHYTRLTDLAWSGDGRILALSSTDGYCSLAYFDEGELGEVYTEGSENCNVEDTKQEAEVADVKVDKEVKDLKSEDTKMLKKDEEPNNVKAKTVNVLIPRSKNKSQSVNTSDEVKNESKVIEEVKNESKAIVEVKNESAEKKVIVPENVSLQQKASSNSNVESQSNPSVPGPTIDKEEFLRGFQVKKVKPVNILVPRRAPKAANKSVTNHASQQTTIKKIENSKTAPSPADKTDNQALSVPSTSKSGCSSAGSKAGEEIEEDIIDSEESGEEDEEGDDDDSIIVADEEEELQQMEESDSESIEEDVEEEQESEIDDEKIDLGEEDTDEDEQDDEEENYEGGDEPMDVDDDDEGNGNEATSSKTETKKSDSVIRNALGETLCIRKSSEEKSKPARRVSLISVPLGNSLPSSKSHETNLKSTQDTKPRQSKDQSAFISQDTEDLCLKLEGEPTVTSPVKSQISNKCDEPALDNKLVSLKTNMHESLKSSILGDSTKKVTNTSSVESLKINASEDLKLSDATSKQSVGSSPLPRPCFGSGSKPPRRVALITLASPKAKRALTCDESKSSSVVAKALQEQ